MRGEILTVIGGLRRFLPKKSAHIFIMNYLDVPSRLTRFGVYINGAAGRNESDPAPRRIPPMIDFIMSIALCGAAVVIPFVMIVVQLSMIEFYGPAPVVKNGIVQITVN